MAIEIERKFLVRNDEWRTHATSEAAIRQAYLASGDRSSTRVRIQNAAAATVAIKSKKTELRRLEIEYEIAIFDAEALMSLRLSEIVEKTRYTVPLGRHTWEIDVFSGRNQGLVIAEIELQDVGETFGRPHWLGVEVTGQSQYYNGSLARLPILRVAIIASRSFGQLMPNHRRPSTQAQDWHAALASSCALQDPCATREHAQDG